MRPWVKVRGGVCQGRGPTWVRVRGGVQHGWGSVEGSVRGGVQHVGQFITGLTQFGKKLQNLENPPDMGDHPNLRNLLTVREAGLT